MAEDLVLDIDFNITKAEAKAEKLQREFEISKQKAANIKDEMQKTADSIEQSKQKQKQLTAELEQSSQRLDAYYNNQLQLSDKQVQAELKRNSEIQKRIDKEEIYQAQQTRILAKQDIALTQQNATTASIGNNIALGTKKTSKFKQALENSNKSANKLGKRIGGLVTRVFMFSVITKALRSLREQFGEMINEQGTKTAELAAKLKGGLSVIGTTLYETARPTIEWILNALVKMVNILANGLAKILGKDINEMKKLASATKETGEEAKKATAGFDTIQTIDTSSNSSSSSDSGVGTDFSALNDGIDSEIAMLTILLSGATLILGVILAFTGVAIGLGIALMVIGAAGLVSAIAASWDTLPNNIQNTILIIFGIVSVALLVLGAIFCFTGHIPLGVAFLALGAVGLATVAAVAMNKLPDDIKNVVSIIAAIVAGALIVIGMILLATGVALGLGLGLLVAGAALMVGTMAANWSTLPDKTKDVISWIMAIGGLLMLVIGIILCFTGVGIPLGIALIAIGAAALVSSIALNWNAITDKVKKIASSIGDIFKKCWNGIKTGFKSMVNGIIDLANLWIKGLNLLLTPVRGLIYGIAKAFGSDVKFDDIAIPTIPKLATGAVLPGGSPMLAWVNDQPKGQGYIEGSIDNIAAAFEKYLGSNNIGNQNININFKGSLSQLARILSPEITKENTRASIHT